MFKAAPLEPGTKSKYSENVYNKGPLDVGQVKAAITKPFLKLRGTLSHFFDKNNALQLIICNHCCLTEVGHLFLVYLIMRITMSHLSSRMSCPLLSNSWTSADVVKISRRLSWGLKDSQCCMKPTQTSNFSSCSHIERGGTETRRVDMENSPGDWYRLSFSVPSLTPPPICRTNKFHDGNSEW